MRNAIVSEFRKMTSTRSAFVMLAALLAVTALVAYGGVAGDDVAGNLTGPLESQPFLLLPLSTATIFTMILGIRSFTDEFRHGSIVPTFLATPDRRRVLAAKVVSVGAVAALSAVAAIGTALAVGVAVMATEGLEITWSADAMAQVSARLVVAGVLWSAIGVGLGVVVRHQLAAIVGVAVWSMALEPAVAAVLPGLGRYLPDAASRAIIGFDSAGLLAPAAAIAVLGAWAALGVGVGARLVQRRDVV